MGNWNADDPNNPIQQILAGRSLYGKAGGMLYVNGNNTPPTTITDGSLANSVLWNDPRYFRSYTESGSEGGGGETRWDLTDDAKKRLNGKVQIGPKGLNVGDGAGNVIDPSKVIYDEEFGLITDPSNIRADKTADWQDLGLFTAVGIGLGGATAAHAAGAGAGAGGSAAAAGDPLMLAPGMESQALLESSLLNQGIMPGTAQWTAAGGGAMPTGAAPGAGTQPPAPVSTASPATPGGGAPVSNSVPPVHGTGAGAGSSSSGGIINGVRDAWNGMTGWYDGLSPASRFIVNSAASQGAQALIGANSQREAQQAADEAERRAEEDRIRRGRVPAFKPGTFTPKPTGIINGARKPGG